MLSISRDTDPALDHLTVKSIPKGFKMNFFVILQLFTLFSLVISSPVVLEGDHDRHQCIGCSIPCNVCPWPYVCKYGYCMGGYPGVAPIHYGYVKKHKIFNSSNNVLKYPSNTFFLTQQAAPKI